MSKYLNWLYILILLGPKHAAPIIAALQALFDAIGAAAADIPKAPSSGVGGSGAGGLGGTGDGVLSLTQAFVAGEPVTAEVLEAEHRVLAMTVPEGSQAFLDFAKLRGLFDFLQKTGALDWVMTYLLKRLAGQGG